jgi:RNA polymerase sigma-70 factor (ECF subfamily)
MEESEAIARLKQGNLEGLEELVRRYQVQAVQAAYLVVRDRPLAEDVVQAAFIRASDKIDQFDDQRSFGPWFLRSVLNAAIKAARSEERLVSLDDDQDGIPALAGRLASSDPLPGQWVESEETRQAVWQALGLLPPGERAVIVMRHFLEMSDAEVAAELDRPLTTVKWWLHTSRLKLRELLRSIWLDHNERS